MERMKLKPPRARLDLAEVRRRRVAELHNSGLRQVEIAESLGITQARVSQILTRAARKRPALRLRFTMPTEAGVPA